MSFEDITQRTDHRNLSLVGQQLAYLTTRETGDNNASSLENTITDKKFSKLSIRLQYLIEDLALLHTTEFIDSDQWEKTWNQLNEMAHRNRVYSPPRGIKNTHEDDYPHYQFGVQIGHLARLLCKNSAPEFNDTEITCGFFLGLAGKFMTNPDPGAETSEDATTSGGSNELTSSSILSGPSGETLEMLEVVQRVLVDSQETAPTSFEDLAATQALEEVGLKPCAPLRDEVWQRVNEIDYPASDSLVESSATKLQSDERIKQAEELAEIITADLELLSNKKYGRNRFPVFTSEVFHAVCSQVDPNNSDIRNRVRENRRDKPAKQTISKLRNDLQGEGTDSRHWNENPLVKENSGTYKPTDYGGLIGIIITPDAPDRDSDKHLPQPDAEEESFCIPSKEQVLTACYACALGQPSKTHQKIFDAAYQERTAD